MKDHRRAEREREGDHEAGERCGQERPPQALDLDLAPREEEEAGKPDGREDLDGGRRRSDADPVRPDDDAADELQHDRRDQDLRGHPADQRRQEGDHRHDDEAGVWLHLSPAAPGVQLAAPSR